MTREDRFSQVKSRCLYDAIFKRQPRNAFAAENLGQRPSVSARRRSMASLRRNCRSNLPAPWQPRLPTEVWCAIWAWLPFSARITVTHTCRPWRLAALACPSLWTHPQFCTAITPSTSSYLDTSSDCATDGQTARNGVSNLACASEILSRSKDLYLHITLDVPTLKSALDMIQDLGLELSQASHRIASITVSAVSPEAADTLMWELRSLPALRRLALQSCKPVTEVFDGPLRPLMHSDMCAVNLEDVEVGPGFYWPRDGPQFPKVRRVLLTIDGNLHHDVRTVLDACAELQVLTVDLGALFCPDWPVGDSVSASLRGRCARLRAVRLMNLSANNAEIALSTFHAPAIPDISISTGRDSVGDAGIIFRDLSAAVRLAVLQHSGQVTVAASDRDRRARRVSCTESKFSQTSRDTMLHAMLPKCIDWRNVVMLSVSASHWFRCVDALPVASAVRRLRLLIDNTLHGRILDRTPGPYDPSSTSGKFPALRRLDIVGTGGAARMTADDIAGIIYSLDINLPVRSLGVDHTVLEGSRAALRELALKVAIRIYRV